MRKSEQRRYDTFVGRLHDQIKDLQERNAACARHGLSQSGRIDRLIEQLNMVEQLLEQERRPKVQPANHAVLHGITVEELYKLRAVLRSVPDRFQRATLAVGNDTLLFWRETPADVWELVEVQS